MIKDINKLGEALTRRISGLSGLKDDVENMRQDIGTDLRIIWEALESGQTVNGATNKKEWCAYAKITPRYAQYLVKDGSRKKQQTRTTVRVLDGMKIGLRGLELDEGEGEVSVEFEKVRIDTYKGKQSGNNGDWSDKADKDGVRVWQHRVREISGHVSFEFEDATLTQEQVIAELLKKMKSGLKALHLWDEKMIADYKEAVQEYLQGQEDRKEYRSRTAKKAAVTRKARKPIPHPYADGKPTNLDKFRARMKASEVKKLTADDTRIKIGEFGAIFKSTNKDNGKRTWAEKYGEAFETEASEHPEWRGQQIYKELERIRIMIHSRGISDGPKTHKMMPGDHRTYCGKTPGDTLSKDAAMEDFPSCRGCQSGEWTAKARAIDAGMQSEHPAAKALAAAVDGADSNIPKHVEDTVERQKSRIALGLHPVSGACPTDSTEEV